MVSACFAPFISLMIHKIFCSIIIFPHSTSIIIILLFCDIVASLQLSGRARQNCNQRVLNSTHVQKHSYFFYISLCHLRKAKQNISVIIYCIGICFHMCMLWFKFFLGVLFFELLSIIFVIVPDYGNQYITKENKK